MKKDYSIKRSEEEDETVMFFFEKCESEGMLADFSSKELIDLHRRAFEGDYTSQQLMIEILIRLLPQLNWDRDGRERVEETIKRIREGEN